MSLCIRTPNLVENIDVMRNKKMANLIKPNLNWRSYIRQVGVYFLNIAPAKIAKLHLVHFSLKIWHGNNFNNFLENQLIKFRAFYTVKANQDQHFCQYMSHSHESMPREPNTWSTRNQTLQVRDLPGVWRAADSEPYSSVADGRTDTHTDTDSDSSKSLHYIALRTIWSGL